MIKFLKKFQNKYLFKGNLKPDNAVCVIITYKGKMLLQKRDNKKNIFFPNHFGLFGGAIEKKETRLKAIQREIFEELNIFIEKKRFSYLTSIKIDFFKIVKKKFERTFYYFEIKDKEIKNIKLGEGSAMIWSNLYDNYSNIKLVPYDSFAIWLYLFKK